jgi:hypothetical protein
MKTVAPAAAAAPKPVKQVTRSLIASSAEGYPLLGECAYWSLTNINMVFSEFVAKLQEAGISPEIAGEVRSKSALVRAIQKETATRKNSFYRTIESPAHTLFVIVAQRLDASTANKVDFQTDTQIIFDKKTSQIKVDGYNAQAVHDGYKAEQGFYNVDNAREAILRYLRQECMAISVRDNGGVYFVPSTYSAEFQKLQKFFAFFPQCSLGIIPVIDTAQAKKSMWKSLVGEIEAQLASEKEKLQTNPPTTDRGIEARLKVFKSLQSKVEMYETLLTGTASSLKTELSSLSALLKQHLV